MGGKLKSSKIEDVLFLIVVVFNCCSVSERKTFSPFIFDVKGTLQFCFKTKLLNTFLVFELLWWGKIRLIKIQKKKKSIIVL